MSIQTARAAPGGGALAKSIEFVRRKLQSKRGRKPQSGRGGALAKARASIKQAARASLGQRGPNLVRWARQRNVSTVDYYR